jgi:hypothetical protein
MDKIEKINGGSAFPHKQINLDAVGFQHIPASAGMSLRDWFAGMALQGFIANGSLDEICNQFETADVVEQKLSEFCFNLADAMIEEREK